MSGRRISSPKGATRSRAILVAGLATAFLALTACVRFNKFYNARRDFAEAERLSNQREAGSRPSPAEGKKYQACIARCQDIVTEHPNSSFVDDCMLLVGKSWLNQGEPAKAERWLQRLSDEYPRSSLAEEAEFLLGKVARAGESPSLAASRLLQFVERNPESQWRAEALLELVLALTEAGRGDSALTLGLEALVEGDLDRVEQQLQYHVGLLLLDRAQWGEADEAFAAAAQGRDRSLRFEAQLRRGASMEAGGRLDEATELYAALERDARADSQIAKAGLAMAEVALGRGDVDGALDKFTEIVELFPNVPQASDAHYRMARIYLALVGDMDLAEEHLSQAAKGRRWAQPARRALDSLEELDRLREALALGDSAELWHRAGECYLFELEVPESAAACYAGAVELGDSLVSPRAALALARVLEKIARADESRVVLEELVQDYPMSPQAGVARELLGLAPSDSVQQQEGDADRYHQAERALIGGDYQTALDLFSGVVSSSDQGEWAAKAQYATAWTLQEKLGRTAEARREYEELLELFPSTPYAREASARLGVEVADTTGSAEESPAVPESPLVARCDTAAYGALRSVQVQVRVLPDGRVAEVVIGDGSGSLACDEEVRDVAQRARFRPAVREGEAAEGWWEGEVEVIPLSVAREPEIVVIEPSGSTLDSVPTFTVHRAPSYPPGMLALAEGEAVVLTLGIDATGSISSTRIEEAPEAVRQNVMQAVGTWRFRPGYQEGQPVATQIRVEFVVEAEPKGTR
jgi:TonB family protein